MYHFIPDYNNPSQMIALAPDDKISSQMIKFVPADNFGYR
jgi:hypothetical protein